MKHLLLLCVLLSGCASYTYEKTELADGTKTCIVSITSTRNVELGSVSIGQECETAGGAEGMEGEAIILNIIKALASPSGE